MRFQSDANKDFQTPPREQLGAVKNCRVSVAVSGTSELSSPYTPFGLIESMMLIYFLLVVATGSTTKPISFFIGEINL